MFRSTKNDILAFPFEDCVGISDPQELEEWALAHSLTNFNHWMLPQILAYFGRFRVQRNEQGLYDPKLLVEDNFRGNRWATGLWRITTRLKRSALVKTQVNAQHAEYSALVPLVLAGIKKYQGIAYSDWAAEGLQNVVDPGLYDAMMCEPPTITKERQIELREQGLMTKSGPKAGQLKKATSTWTLTGLKGTEWGDLPPLALTMLAQIWVAHPSIRSNYMILDPQNWDNMPDPLIETQVYSAEKQQKLTATDIPWDL